MFVCANIGLGQTITIKQNNGGRPVFGNGQEATGSLPLVVKVPHKFTVNITENADNIGDVHGAYVNDAMLKNLFSRVPSYKNSGKKGKGKLVMGNKVKVYDIKPGFGHFKGTDKNNKNIYGARAYTKETEMIVHDNKVEISGGFNIRDVVGGGAYKGTVSLNTVTISNKVKIGGDVLGGAIEQDGTATANTVDLTNVTVEGNVHGANIIGVGNASKNTVKLTNVAVEDSVYGAQVQGQGEVKDNEVIIKNLKSEKDIYVFGGLTASGDAIHNQVTIEGGTVDKVYGGRILEDGNGNAINNIVKLTDVAVENDVYGAFIEGQGEVKDNEVIIKDLKSAKNVYGGWTTHGNAIHNQVTIINGLDVKGIITGRFDELLVTGGYINQNGTIAELNEVNLTNVLVGCVLGACSAGSGTATGNKVYLTNVAVVNDVYGACVHGQGGVEDNEVIIEHSVHTKDVFGGWIVRGNATGNKVTINGKGIEGEVYGGYIHQNGTAGRNEVTLDAAEVKNDVFGVKIGGSGTAVRNTVTINDGANVTGNVFGAWVTKIEEDAIPTTLNKVTINGGKVTGNVTGARIIENAGDVAYNSVEINGGEITGSVFGAKIGKVLMGEDINIKQNSVTINGGKVTGSVYGVCIDKVEKQRKKLSGNQVKIKKNVEFAKERCHGAMVDKVKIKGDDNDVFIIDSEEEKRKKDEEESKKQREHQEQERQQLEQREKEERDRQSLLQQEREREYQERLRQYFLQQQQERQQLEQQQQQYLQQQEQQQQDQQQLDREQHLPQVVAQTPVEEIEAKPEEKREFTPEQINELKKLSWDKQWDKITYFMLQNQSQIQKRLEQLHLTQEQMQKLMRELQDLGISQQDKKLQKLELQKLQERFSTKRLEQLQLSPTQIQELLSLHQQEQEQRMQEFEMQELKERFPKRLEQLKQLSEAQRLELQGLTKEEQEKKLQEWQEQQAPPEFVIFVNTAIDINGPTEFSTATILCGGICADQNAVFRGATLNIRTKGIEVKGISNFENYNFYLKDIKAGETILTATSGGCSWSAVEHDYTPACEMDLSRSNIYLQTQGVLNKGDYYTLIRSQKRFKNNVKYKKFDFENEELLIKYYWEVILTDDGQNLTAKLIDKKIRDEGIARSLSEGYGAGIVCVNNGMDCIFSKMEETEEQSSEELSPKEQSSKSLLGEGAKLGAKPGAKPQGKGEIGAFGGLAASKSKYDIDKGSHIDMIGTSMMGGVGKVVEVREKELTVGVFAEYGTGNSDIHCKKESKCESSYIGGGLLGRYNIYENEFSGTKGQSPKLYVEAILRAGQASINFDGNEIKNLSGKEIKYEIDAMYGGCAVGGGYKHKVSEKIDLDWSLRYMVGYQDGKGAKQADADGNKAKFESITSNRIRIGVRGKYVELEKIKPYAGIGCEYELDGKVKGTLRNGVDMLNIPASDFGGVTGVGELGASGKVWKFGVDISGQGYLGVRKGFGGMLKLKYAFGKDAHGSKASSKASRQGKRAD